MTMSKGKARSGGGIRSNKVRQIGNRVGPPRTNVISPQAVTELGMATNWPRQPLVKGTAPQVRSGNDVAATTVCGPGGSRTIYKSGYQDLHGKVSQGEGKIGGNAGKDILSEFGPERSRG